MELGLACCDTMRQPMDVSPEVLDTVRTHKKASKTENTIERRPWQTTDTLASNRSREKHWRKIDIQQQTFGDWRANCDSRHSKFYHKVYLEKSCFIKFVWKDHYQINHIFMYVYSWGAGGLTQWQCSKTRRWLHHSWLHSCRRPPLIFLWFWLLPRVCKKTVFLVSIINQWFQYGLFHTPLVFPDPIFV